MTTTTIVDSLEMNDTVLLSIDKHNNLGDKSRNNHNSQSKSDSNHYILSDAPPTEKLGVRFADSTLEYPPVLEKSSTNSEVDVHTTIPTITNNNLRKEGIPTTIPIPIPNDMKIQDSSSQEITNSIRIPKSDHDPLVDNTQSSELTEESSYGFTEDGLPDFGLKGACHLSCFLYRRNRSAITHIDLDQVSCRQLHNLAKDRQK